MHIPNKAGQTQRLSNTKDPAAKAIPAALAPLRKGGSFPPVSEHALPPKRSSAVGKPITATTGYVEHPDGRHILPPVAIPTKRIMHGGNPNATRISRRIPRRI